MQPYFHRQLTRRSIIRRRLAEASQRTGFTLPARVPVSLEQLQDIERQLRAALQAQPKPDISKPH